MAGTPISYLEVPGSNVDAENDYSD